MNYSKNKTSFTKLIQTSQYYLDYYIPSILLVSMSWVSFWLEPSAIPGRTTLGRKKTMTMTSESRKTKIESISGTGSWLTYINLHKNINDNVSRVHYIKYIDIWFLVSTFFIFLSHIIIIYTTHYRDLRVHTLLLKVE